MTVPARRTLWTGSTLALAAAAFVSAFVLLEGLPARSDAAQPRVERIALAPARPAPQPAVARAAEPEFVVKRILPIEGPLKYGEWHWDESGAPATGTTVVTVDLAANVLSVFRDGYEIGATAVLTGFGDKPTPLGIFPITEKDADHVSNLYDAPMPHMLRLTDDGITIHGTKVENGYVTHGCVGVPDDFARKLFATARLGDRVIVTDGKMMKLGDPIV
jgi:lipoprotein-anchoring transpeptidase ErfK/SrfK